MAALAHPEWELPPTRFDLAYALLQAIAGMDLVRAQLLVEIVYRQRQGVPALTSFDLIKADVQERITYLLGERYERLRLWLEEYRQSGPRRAGPFPQPPVWRAALPAGFRLPRRLRRRGGRRQPGRVDLQISLGRRARPAGRRLPHRQEYLLMVQDGVIAAQYIRSLAA